MVHHVEDKIRGKRFIETYVLRQSDSKAVKTVHRETVLDGTRMLLSLSPAHGAVFDIDEQGRVVQSGAMLSSGRLSVATDASPNLIESFWMDPYTGKPMIETLEKNAAEINWQSVTSGGTPTWEAKLPYATLSFDAKTGGLRNAMFFEADPRTGEPRLLREATVAESRMINGVSIPIEFAIRFVSSDGTPDRVQKGKLVTERCHVNIEVANEIIPPQFPVGCLVHDEIKQRTYTVSEYEKLNQTAPELIEFLDKIITEAEEQKSAKE